TGRQARPSGQHQRFSVLSARGRSSGHLPLGRGVLEYPQLDPDPRAHQLQPDPVRTGCADRVAGAGLSDGRPVRCSHLGAIVDVADRDAPTGPEPGWSPTRRQRRYATVATMGPGGVARRICQDGAGLVTRRALVTEL